MSSDPHRQCKKLLGDRPFEELHELLRTAPKRRWSDPKVVSQVKTILKSDPYSSKAYQLVQELVLMEDEYEQ